MKGTIVVLPKASGVPTEAALARQGKAKLAALNVAAVKNLKRARAHKSPATTVQIGPGVGPLETLAFFPSKNTVPAGTTVKFQMAGVNEFHTVTFGPTAYVDPVERAFQSNGRPGGRLPERPARHAGVRDAHDPRQRVPQQRDPPRQGLPPGPHSFSVTFPTAGVYAYRCMVHPEMRGSITVS